MDTFKKECLGEKILNLLQTIFSQTLAAEQTNVGKQCFNGVALNYVTSPGGNMHLTFMTVTIFSGTIQKYIPLSMVTIGKKEWY